MRDFLKRFFSRLRRASSSLAVTNDSSSPRRRVAAFVGGGLLAAFSLYSGSLALLAQGGDLPVIGISRHVLTNNGRIEGSAQQFLGENNNLNSSADFYGDFFVPGSPNVNVNGTPLWSGQQNGSGSASPSNYTINVNSGAKLRYLVKRTDPGTLAAISAPPTPGGNRDLNIDNPSQVAGIGDWATVRNLNLNSNAGNVAVPPGTYGNFTASNSNNTGFVFGVAGSNSPSVYNLQQLTLNSNSRLTLVGPVVITVRNQVAVNSNTAILGSSDNHSWLKLSSSHAGFYVNSGAIIYGEVTAPSGHIQLNGTIVGTAAGDYLTVNSSGVLKPGQANHAPNAQNDSYSTNEGTTLTVSAPGVLGNDSDPDGNALTAVKLTNPAHGTLTFNPDGSFVYVPNANYEGTDSFTYQASDGTLSSATATVTITVNPVNDAPVAQNGTLETDEDAPVNGQLQASDADGDALTYSIVTQPQHGTVQLQNDGSFTYTPAANFHGEDSFVFKANDGQADSNEATVTITVNPLNDAPVAVDDAYTTAKNTALTIAAPGVLQNDSDVDSTVLTAAVTTQPAHGTLALNANGGFVYTPANGFTGTDTFTYRASDGTLQSNIATVTITVEATNAPPTAQNGSVTTPEDTPVAVTLQASDPDGDTLSYQIVTSPQHGALSGTGAQLTYTPHADYHGEDSFVFKANDGQADSNQATVTITLTPVNDAPYAQDNAYTVAEDTALQGQVVATDAENQPLSFSVVTGPQHGMLILNADGSFTYTPTTNYTGSDNFVFKANDGQADSNHATVSITITPANDAPVAQNDSYTTNEDVPLVVVASGVLGNDSDPDGDALSAVLVAGPTKGTLTLNANGSFTYIPQANYHGSDSFTYRASDGTAQSNVATVSITIAPINDAPVALDGEWTISEGNVLQANVQAQDADGDALSFLAVAQPAHGTLVLNADGSFTYTPQAGFHGTDSFTFKANDGTVDSDTATVTITVNPVNDAPVAVNDQYTTTRNTPLTVAAPGVLGNDSDLDGDTLFAVAGDAPQHGTLTLNANGSFTYTPNNGYVGSDSFTYRARDRAGEDGLLSNVATVTITVTHTNTPPVAQDGSATTDEDTPVDVTLQASDADGDTLSYSIVAAPAHGTLSGTAPNLIYTPNANYNGTDSFTFKANDGQGDSNVATITITVAPVNDPPVAVHDSVSTRYGEEIVIDVLANDSDPDGDALTITAISGGQGGVATITADNKIRYVPNPGFSGLDTFVYTISDGNGGQASAGLGVTVGQRPSLSINSVQVNEGNAGQNTQAELQLTLSQAAAVTVTANWATADGTATVAEEDYTAGSGSVTFAPGETTKTITVTIRGDDFHEPDETFRVILSNPVHVSLAQSVGTVTILNDDAPPEEGACGPIDVAFVIDDTGSMGGAIDNIKQELANILQDIEETSDNNYRLSLVTYKDDVTVRVPFAQNNRAAFAPEILGLYADGGAGGPEASDEALNTVINALPAGNGRPQTGDAIAFRPNALKLIILVTDALPAGFDDDFTVGIDDFQANRMAVQAAQKKIKIATIHVNPEWDFEWEMEYGVGVGTVLRNLSSMSGSRYIPTNNAGQGAEVAVRDIVRTCGGFEVPEYCNDTQAPVVTITAPADNARVADLSPISGTMQDTGCSSPYATHLKIKRLADNTYWGYDGWMMGWMWRTQESWVSTKLETNGTWKLEDNNLLAGYNLPEGDYEITAVGYDRELNASQPVTIRVTVGKANNAAFVSQNVPQQMTAGQEYTVSVTMKNTGLRPWSASSSYRLGSQNEQENQRWGMNRVQLPEAVTVAENQEHTFTFTVTAPAVNGVYNFQWRMVQDGVEWFGDTTPNVPITVSGGVDSVVDVLARNADETEYVGDNIYNTTGQNQSRAQSLPAGQTATYVVKIQNDGPHEQSLPLYAQSPGYLPWEPEQPWTIRAFTPEGYDVSYDLFEWGWQTPVLAPGGEYTLRVEVTPTRSAPINTPHEIRVHGRGYGEWSAQQDTVLLTTTRVSCGDVTPPTVDITQPSDGAIVNSLTTITGVAADVGCGGLSEVNVAVRRVSDSAWWHGYGGFYGEERWHLATLGANDQWSYNDGYLQGGWLPAGEYDIIARAYDSDSNQAQVTRRVTVQHPRPRPDAMVRRGTEGAYLGEGVYNNNGAGQTAQGSTLDGTVTYNVQIKNTGPVAGETYLYGNGWWVWDPQGWDVKVFDGTTDITWQVFEFGGPLRMLQPGESVELRVEVTPSAQVPLNAQLPLGLTAYTWDDWGEVRDVVGIVTAKREPEQAPARPDAQIRAAGDTAFAGDDVYNEDATNQTANANVENGQSATYYLRLQNDSADADTMRLFSGDANNWTVSFFDSADNDISTAVKSTEGWTSASLASGAWTTVKMTVAPATEMAAGSTLTLTAAARSGRDPQLVDVVKAVTTVTEPSPPRPDAQIRAGGSPNYIGDNVYSDDGLSQTATLEIDGGQSATYFLKLQNDSTDPDRLKLFSGDTAEWEIAFFDSANNNISAAVKSEEGWTTAQLAGGGETTVRLTVTPGEEIIPGSSLALAMAVRSQGEPSLQDVVRAVTTIRQPSPARPDGQIRVSGAAEYSGDDTYNATAAGQTATVEVESGQGATYELKLQNDSADADRLVLLSGDTTAWEIKFFDSADNEITAAVKSGNGWTSPLLAAGASVEVRAVVTPTALATPGSTLNLLLPVYSQREPQLLDMLKAVTSVKVPPVADGRADGLIRKVTETDYIGDNIYNTTGQGQTSQQVTAAGAPAMFFVLAQNDGNVTQALQLFAVNDVPGWTVKYFDNDNDTEITGQLGNGGTWQTPLLAPGEDVVVRVEIEPEPALPAMSELKLPLGVSSMQDGSQDVVVAWVAVSGFPPVAPQAPDLIIGNGMQPTEWVGNNIYNATGENQERSQQEQARQKAIYSVALQNDGSSATAFRVSTPGAPEAGWTVRFLDADDAFDDITSRIRSENGWQTPSIAAGAVRYIRVEVTPGYDVADNAVLETLLLAKTEDGEQVDAVKMLTTRLPGPPEPDTLPAPVITPAGGTYTGMVKVTITAGEGSPATTVLYYTLDGSEPGPNNPASRMVPGVIALAQDATVTAKAFAYGFDPSPPASESYTITRDPGVNAPGVAITSPANGFEPTAPTTVRGTVQSDGLAYWELEARLANDSGQQGNGGNSGWQRLAWGEDLKSDAPLGTLDPTLLLNGLYELRLTAYDRAGQSAQDTIFVVVKGGMKIGHFTLGFTDMVLPVAGLPLTVTRTYDSRDKRMGDFGVGWTLDISNVRVQKNGPVGGSDQEPVWNIRRVGGIFTGYWSITPTKARIITITLPDGQVYSFRAKFVPENAPVIPNITFGDIVWTAQPGTKGTLETAGSTYVEFFSNDGPITLYDENGQDFNPKEFLLKLPDGREFYIEEGVGMHWLRDRNGNRIDLVRGSNGRVMELRSTPDGSGASARTVSISRSTDGLVTAITDANGKQVLYTQDENNDLTQTTDRVGNVTRFSYDPRHHLMEVRDPRGVQAVRNEYDDDGRLLATIDAKGHRIEFAHDLSNNREVVLDRKGRQSVLLYDDYGNVTATTHFLDGRAITTASEYADANNPDKPTKVTDALGHSTHFVYDGNGNPTQITDPLGHVTQSTYDGTQVKTVKDAANVTVVDNTYNAKGQLIASKDALNNVTQYEYYANGAPSRVIDAKGKSTFYTLDSRYNVSQVTDAAGHVTNFAYDANGNCTGQSTMRTAAGVGVQSIVMGYVYDSSDRLTQTVRADGSRSYTVYNAIGQVDYTRDPLYRITSFEYDELGQRIQTTYPDGTTMVTTYDLNGNVQASRDRANRITTYQYDDLDRQTRIILPGGASTRQVYDDAGRVIESYDEKNNKTSYEYDAAGRQTKTTNALGQSSETIYDTRDRQSSVKDALNKITSFTYNDGGQLLSTTFADATTTSTVYDELGRAVQQTDQSGRITQFGFDDLGRLTSVTQVMDASDPTKNLVTTYGYDEVGNKLWQQDAKGQRTEFAYDNLGRMIGRKLPGGQTEQLAYNAGGQLIGKTDFAGKVTAYAYDQRGRLVAKTPDASLGESVVSFSYPNELTKISTRGSIQNIYRYDAQRGWLDSVQTPNGKLEYNYDAAGNRTQLKVTGKDGGTRIANFTYDALNRVSQITRPGIGTLATYSYNAVGNRTQTQRANGVMSTYGYDDLHRLTGIEHKKGTEVLSQFAYDLNNDGKRGTLTEYVKYPEGQPVASINRTVHYGYDKAGRLIGEQRQSRQTLAAGGSIDKTAHTVWTYDKANNRLTQNLSNYDGLGTGTTSVLTSTHATQYNYNSNDWLQTQTSEYTTSSTTNTYTTNYEYNGNGSQSAVTSNVGTPEQKRVPYFYDFEEKLIGIGNPTDTNKHAYAYDADGNRVTETNYLSGTSTTKHYLIDPNVSHAQVVEEFDNANQLLAHHDWDDAELLRSAVADSEGNAHITHPLADGHNSTRQLMDATGNIGGVLGYDAWGNAQESIGLSSTYRYNGQRLDASGLYHLRARQYAPWSGRFLSHDPVVGSAKNPITQHRYLYSNNDAVNFVDPSGLFADFTIGGMLESISIQQQNNSEDARRSYQTKRYVEKATTEKIFDVYFFVTVDLDTKLSDALAQIRNGVFVHAFIYIGPIMEATNPITKGAKMGYRYDVQVDDRDGAISGKKTEGLINMKSTSLAAVKRSRVVGEKKVATFNGIQYANWLIAAQIIAAEQELEEVALENMQLGITYNINANIQDAVLNEYSCFSWSIKMAALATVYAKIGN